MKIRFIIFFFYSVPRLLFSQIASPILRLNTEMHWGMITEVRVSSSGKYLLTVSLDKTAKLWSAETGELIRTYHIPISIIGADGALNIGDISPDETQIALGGKTLFGIFHYVYIMDLETGKMLQTLSGFLQAISDIKYSPDGKYLIIVSNSRSDDDGIFIYTKDNSGEWKLYKTITDFPQNTNLAIDINKDGKLAVGAGTSFKGEIRLYDKDFKLIKSKKFGQYPIVAFSEDGEKLAVLNSATTNIKILDANSLKILFEPIVPKSEWKYQLFYAIGFDENRNLYAGGIFTKNNQNSIIK